MGNYIKRDLLTSPDKSLQNIRHTPLLQGRHWPGIQQAVVFDRAVQGLQILLEGEVWRSFVPE
jgi:hypothetical protein